MSSLTPRHPGRRPAAGSELRPLAVTCGALGVVVGAASGWGGVPLHVVALLAAVVAAVELVVLPGAEPAREPAVVQVRASVERLDGLAARGASGAQVAAELHALEQAVASLLGTAGLPAAAVPQRRSSPAVEWTTTGSVR